MPQKGFGSARYFRLGALWWILLAAMIGLAHVFVPDLAETPLVVASVVIGMVIAGLVVLWFVRPK